MLSAVTADGALGFPLAVVRHTRAVGPGPTGVSSLIRRALDETTADSLATDIANGADGILATGLAAPADVERLSARLSVAEAMLDRPDRSIAIAMLVETAALVAVLGGHALPRMTGIGIDTAAVAESIGLPGSTGGAALVTARGLVVIAAAAAGVPAFERLTGPLGPARLGAVRADGFAWVMSPLVDP